MYKWGFQLQQEYCQLNYGSTTKFESLFLYPEGSVYACTRVHLYTHTRLYIVLDETSLKATTKQKKSQFCFTFIGKSSPLSKSFMLITWAWFYCTQNLQLQKKQNYSRSPHSLILLLSLTKEWLMNQGHVVPEVFFLCYSYIFISSMLASFFNNFL